MAAFEQNTQLTYIKEFTPAGDPNTMGKVSIKEISNMEINEFYNIKNRLLICRETVYYDTLVYDAGTSVTTAMQPLAFSNGLKETNQVVNTATTYQQQRFHTNMSQGGNFPAGSLTIVYAIEYNIKFNALRGTTYTDAQAYGANTNPLGVAPAAYDPFLLETDWLRQTELQLLRDGDQTIIRNQAQFFPVNNGVSGALGSSVGGVAQNIDFGGNQALLKNPQVFIDNAAFNVQINHLAPFNLTSASGLNIGFITTINLRSVAFREVYA